MLSMLSCCHGGLKSLPVRIGKAFPERLIGEPGSLFVMMFTATFDLNGKDRERE